VWILKKELKANGYERTAITHSETSIVLPIGDAVVKYREYMSGEFEICSPEECLARHSMNQSILPACC
jgi:hypothetical protein